jgi:very-short-patch-repair endonuclease
MEDDWGEATPDFYCRHAKLEIFCDSDEFHSFPEARARDNGVTSALQNRRITVLRFTDGEIRKTPLKVANTILRHLQPKRAKRATRPRRDAA